AVALIGQPLPLLRISCCGAQRLVQGRFAGKMTLPAAAALELVEMREALECKRAPVDDRHRGHAGHASQIDRFQSAVFWNLNPWLLAFGRWRIMVPSVAAIV